VLTDFKDFHAEITRLRCEVDFHRKKVRLMGVSVSKLDEDKEPVSQLNLWE